MPHLLLVLPTFQQIARVFVVPTTLNSITRFRLSTHLAITESA